MMGFAVLIIFWAAVYAIDLILKVNHSTQERYLVWNINSGISFGLLKIKWFTKSFNRYFQSLGSVTWFPWNLWFTCGIFLSWLAMVFGVILLTLLVFNTISQRVVEHEVLTPVLPGVNVPFSHIGFLISSIIVAGVVHEVGHAIAALKENVRVDGFGLIFFVVYPGAFTNINTGDLEGLDPTRKLRIFSAGNWHNFITLIIGFLLLSALPFILIPFYSTGNGVSVNYLSQNSVLTGKLGLYHGDIITKINNCPVQNQADWFSCMYTIQQKSLDSMTINPSQINLNINKPYVNTVVSNNTPLKFATSNVTVSTKSSDSNLINLKQSKNNINSNNNNQNYNNNNYFLHSGYCMPVTRIKQLDISAGYKARTVWGNIDCCSNETRSHLCFRYLSNYRFSGQMYHGPRYACLPVRTVTERSPCSVNANCYPQAIRSDLTCVTPSLENSSRLIRLVHSRATPVLFLGNVNDLLQTVAVSNYIPRWNIMPYSLPFYFETFLSYLVAISGALILFNAVPCYSLDGQWILQSSVELLLINVISSRKNRQRFCSLVTFLGSLLIFTNVAMSIYFMTRQII